MLNRRQVSFFLNELNHPSNAKQERLANKQTRTLLPKDSCYWKKKDSGVERSGRVKEKGSREKGVVSYRFVICLCSRGEWVLMDCPRGRVKTRSLSSGIQCPCMDSKHWIDRKPFFSVETLTLPVMSIIAIGRRLKRRVNEKILKSDSEPDVRVVRKRKQICRWLEGSYTPQKKRLTGRISELVQAFRAVAR